MIRSKPVISCPQCHYIGAAGTFIGGSFLIEVILWLLFIVPGLIYTVWRYSTQGHGCPRCGWQYVIKV